MTCNNDMTPASRVVTSRTVDANDGTGPHTTTYSLNGSDLSIVSHDPSGNDTVHNFTALNGTGSHFETQTQSYAGTHSAGTLLKTVTTDYNSQVNPYLGLTGSLTAVNVYPIRVTTTWPNGLVSKVETDYDQTFNTGLSGFRQRGIWGDHSEKTGAVIIEQMRLAAGERASLEERPGHLFGPDEVYETHAYFLLPVLFGWDAFLIPESGDYFAVISHDGVAEVVGRTAEKAEELRQRVRDWNPKEDKSWYPRIASR